MGRIIPYMKWETKHVWNHQPVMVLPCVFHVVPGIFCGSITPTTHRWCLDLALAISLACPSARITCRKKIPPALTVVKSKDLTSPNINIDICRGFQSHSIIPKSSTLEVGFSIRNLPAIGVPPWLRNPPGFRVTTFNHQTSIQVIGNFEWDMFLGHTNFRKQTHILCSAGCRFQWHMCSSLRHDRCTLI